MRIFDYTIIPAELMNHELMNLVSAIHEYRGKQELFIEAKPDVLQAMLEIAKIQSTGASNRIEGIYTSEERLAALVKSKAEPRNRSEQEIAGYREVLSLIHDSYDYMAPRTNVILQLHRDLYQFSPASYGGSFKNSDNVIAEIDSSGQSRVRFQPLSAFETPDAVERLTNTFVEAIRTEKYDPLLLVPLFILDFLCIHPFNDGNGRMSRLLTLLLLYRSGYIVGKYIETTEDLKNNKTYIFVTRNEGIVYKRLVKKREKSIEVSSDNAFYEPYEIPMMDILEIWEFASSISTEEFEPEQFSSSQITTMINDLKIDIKKLENKLSEKQ